MEVLVSIAGWVQEDGALYCTSGRLPYMIRTTMDLSWIELHMYLQCLHLADRYEWMDLHQQFGSAALRCNPQFSISRIQMIVRNYFSLQDWRVKGWQDLKLFGVLTKSLQSRSLQPALASKPAPTRWACTGLSLRAQSYMTGAPPTAYSKILRRRSPKRLLSLPLRRTKSMHLKRWRNSLPRKKKKTKEDPLNPIRNNQPRTYYDPWESILM
jgi:hypothetical protein